MKITIPKAPGHGGTWEAGLEVSVRVRAESHQGTPAFSCQRSSPLQISSRCLRGRASGQYLDMQGYRG